MYIHVQSNLDISKLWGLILQVRITRSANYFALRVIRTCKKSPHNHDSIWESIFDWDRSFDISKISPEFDISEFGISKFACIYIHRLFFQLFGKREKCCEQIRRLISACYFCPFISKEFPEYFTCKIHLVLCIILLILHLILHIILYLFTCRSRTRLVNEKSQLNRFCMFQSPLRTLVSWIAYIVSQTVIYIAKYQALHTSYTVLVLIKLT